MRKVCFICGKPLKSNNGNTKFCSDNCRRTSARIAAHYSKYLDENAENLIRYGQEYPFTKPCVLWIQYQMMYPKGDRDE